MITLFDFLIRDSSYEDVKLSAIYRKTQQTSRHNLIKVLSIFLLRVSRTCAGREDDEGSQLAIRENQFGPSSPQHWFMLLHFYRNLPSLFQFHLVVDAIRDGPDRHRYHLTFVG